MTDTRTDDLRSEVVDDSSRVRGEIDDTREHLGQTVQAIGDRVMPGRIIERRKERTANSLRGWRDRFMGTAENTRQHLADSAGSTIDDVRSSPDALAHKTEGSPLAVGGVAFALGFLAAAVWKPTETERSVVEKVAEVAPDLGADVGELGRDLKDTVKEQAAGVTDELKSSVSHGAAALKSAATDENGANGSRS